MGFDFLVLVLDLGVGFGVADSFFVVAFSLLCAVCFGYLLCGCFLDLHLFMVLL